MCLLPQHSAAFYSHCHSSAFALCISQLWPNARLLFLYKCMHAYIYAFAKLWLAILLTPGLESLRHQEHVAQGPLSARRKASFMPLVRVGKWAVPMGARWLFLDGADVWLTGHGHSLPALPPFSNQNALHIAHCSAHSHCLAKAWFVPPHKFGTMVLWDYSLFVPNS